MSDTQAAAAEAGFGERLAGKYLTFSLGAEEYAVPVVTVREIIKMMDITAVPQVPPHVRGVINLRGKVIPVIDLARKFGFAEHAVTNQTCIIVVHVRLSQPVEMGVLVDSVSEVLNLTADTIEPPPIFGGGHSADAVQAMAKVKASVKILLDLTRVLASDAMVSNAT